mmetsp:Transcript_6591/g.13902  ORF Transcript_6591/g.13902 Transcript_6591/m.13902 type:complete len:217 (+) Transcript_6591:1341-1991(+)
MYAIFSASPASSSSCPSSTILNRAFIISNSVKYAPVAIVRVVLTEQLVVKSHATNCRGTGRDASEHFTSRDFWERYALKTSEPPSLAALIGLRIESRRSRSALFCSVVPFLPADLMRESIIVLSSVRATALDANVLTEPIPNGRSLSGREGISSEPAVVATPGASETAGKNILRVPKHVLCPISLAEASACLLLISSGLPSPFSSSDRSSTPSTFS